MARLLRVAFLVTLAAAVLSAATINERDDDDENESIREKREPSAARNKRQFIIPGRQTLSWGLSNSQSGSRSSGVHRQFSNFNTVNRNVGHLAPAVDSGGNVVVEPGRIIFEGPLPREQFIQRSRFVSNRHFEQPVQDSIVRKLQPELAFNLPSGQLQRGLVGSQQGFQGFQQGQIFGQSQQGNQHQFSQNQQQNQFGQQQSSVHQQNGRLGNQGQQQSLQIISEILSPFQPTGFSSFPGFLRSVFSRQQSQSQGDQGAQQGGGSQFASGHLNGGAGQQSQSFGGSGGQKQQLSSFTSSGGRSSIQPTGRQLSSTALTRRVGLASHQDIEIRQAVRVRARPRYPSSRSRLTQGSRNVKFNRNYQAPPSSHSYDDGPVVDIRLGSTYDIVEVRIRDGHVLNVSLRDSTGSREYQKKRYYSSEERSSARGGTAIEDLILRLEADQIVTSNSAVNKEEAQHAEQNPTQQENFVESHSNDRPPPVKEALAIKSGSSQGDSSTDDHHLYTISLTNDQVLSVLSDASNPIDSVPLEEETGGMKKTTGSIKNEFELITIEDALQAFTTSEEVVSATEKVVTDEDPLGSSSSGDHFQSSIDEHSSSLANSDFVDQTDQTDADQPTDADQTTDADHPIDSFPLEQEIDGIDEVMALITTESELISIEHALQAFTTSEEVVSTTEEVVTGDGSSSSSSDGDQLLSSLDEHSNSLHTSDLDDQTESPTEINEDQSTALDSSAVNHETTIDGGSSDPSSSHDKFGVNDTPTEPTSSHEDISIDIQLETETGSKDDGSGVSTQNMLFGLPSSLGNPSDDTIFTMPANMMENMKMQTDISDDEDDQSEFSTSANIDSLVMQKEEFPPSSHTAQQTILEAIPQSPTSETSLIKPNRKILIKANHEIAQALAQSGSNVGGHGDDNTLIQPNGETLTKANQVVTQTLTQSSFNDFVNDASTLLQPHGKTLTLANQEVVQAPMQSGSIMNGDDDSTLVQPHSKTFTEVNEKVAQILTVSGSNAGDGTLVQSHGRTLTEANREVGQTLMQTGSKFSGGDDSTQVHPHGKTLTEANQEVAQTVIGSTSIAGGGVDSTSHGQTNAKTFNEANQEFTQSFSESGSSIRADDGSSTFQHGSINMDEVIHKIAQDFSETGSKFLNSNFDEKNQEVTRELSDSSPTIREGDDAKPKAVGGVFSSRDSTRSGKQFSSHATQTEGAGLLQGVQPQGVHQLSTEINSGSSLSSRFQFTIGDQGGTAGATPFAGSDSQAIVPVSHLSGPQFIVSPSSVDDDDTREIFDTREFFDTREALDTREIFDSREILDNTREIFDDTRERLSLEIASLDKHSQGQLSQDPTSLAHFSQELQSLEHASQELFSQHQRTQDAPVAVLDVTDEVFHSREVLFGR